eukprot:3222950-Rhodomonas_salina.1
MTGVSTEFYGATAAPTPAPPTSMPTVSTPKPTAEKKSLAVGTVALIVLLSLFGAGALGGVM